MPKKEDLLEKLLRKPMPTNFTVRELDALMKACGCVKFEGGRGSGIGYLHERDGRDCHSVVHGGGGELCERHEQRYGEDFAEAANAGDGWGHRESSLHR